MWQNNQQIVIEPITFTQLCKQRTKLKQLFIHFLPCANERFHSSDGSTIDSRVQRFPFAFLHLPKTTQTQTRKTQVALTVCAISPQKRRFCIKRMSRSCKTIHHHHIYDKVFQFSLPLNFGLRIYGNRSAAHVWSFCCFHSQYWASVAGPWIVDELGYQYHAVFAMQPRRGNK